MIAGPQPAPMNCNAIAPYYQTLEYASFGKHLEKARFAFFAEAVRARRALICGGGDGRFLARLLRGNPGVHADFVDLSSKMAELSERRVAAMGAPFRRRVNFHVEDVRQFTPPRASNGGRYDLVVTNFFLDCFPAAQIDALVSRIASWTAPAAHWLLADFAQAPGFASALYTRAVVLTLYAAFRLTTGLRVTHLPPYLAALNHTGFAPIRQQHALFGLLHSSLWQRAPTQPESAA